MSRARGRAFTALGSALMGLHQQREARELAEQREATRQRERSEDVARASEREEQRRMDDRQWRRAQLLGTPGYYESPDSVTLELPAPMETPRIDIAPPELPTLGGAPPLPSFEASARKTLFGDLPPLPSGSAPIMLEEPNPLPEGHTRPLPGIAHNPRWREEQEAAQNERLVGAAKKMRLPHAELLEFTGPSGLGTLLDEMRPRAPVPGTEAWKRMKEWEWQTEPERLRGGGGASGVTPTSLYTQRAQLARSYINELNNLEESYRGVMPDKKYGETPETLAAEKAQAIQRLNATYGFTGPEEAGRVIREGVVGGTRTDTTMLRPPSGSRSKQEEELFSLLFAPPVPVANPARPPSASIGVPPVPASTPALPRLPAGRNRAAEDTTALSDEAIRIAQQKLRQFPRSAWEQTLRNAGFSPLHINQILTGRGW
jgi:hypothetical protein